MATGYDKLLDFLLSEIALRGVQGASSADFRHFIEVFYKPVVDNVEPKTGESDSKELPSTGLGRAFYERLWQWLTDHPDIRIVYQQEVRRFTLSEFEAAELHETGTIGETRSTDLSQPSSNTVTGTVRPSKALCSLRDSLRQHILDNGHGPKELVARTSETPALTPVSRPIRNLPSGPSATTTAFDDPDPSITAPRLYASQSRVWQSLTGHGIDLKKVPAMEFVLLSLIAARKETGITQPELINISGQDKRSVPKRTDELARKNYISKISVQANKMRTSLCIHAKWVPQNTFIESSAMEDVYQEDGTFVVRNFAQLLYDVVGQGGIVPTRSIREKLKVPMSRWNKRATQGALIRLDQTGMIKRRRILKKASSDKWITCIQVLREPQEEDLKNLGFRRIAELPSGSMDELPDEDISGESLLKDLEADMPDDADADADVDNQVTAKPFVGQADSIPPQWVPDRFLPNIIFNAVATAGVQGFDSEALRNRIVGPFWRRPIESYFTRVTNDWERTQPFHLRHLAVIKDAGTTKGKKFIHYSYRTHENFQKAVDMEMAVWDGVIVPQESEKSTNNELVLDAWGFPVVSTEDLVRETGSATLSEAGSAIVKPRKNGPRWDNALAEEAGYKKLATTVVKVKTPGAARRTKKQKAIKEKPVRIPKVPKASRKHPTILLTPEEKMSLGLDRNARLSRNVQAQILAHRQKTGDPSSLPEAIVDDRVKRQLAQPLLTLEQRLARGLAPKGRLGITAENKIRAERGLPQLVKKEKKRKTKATNEPTVLSKSQRIALGWTDHGRLPAAIIEGLRQEREVGIPLKDSKVIASWDTEMKTRKMETDKKKGSKSNPKQATPPENQDVSMVDPEAEYVPDLAIEKPEAEISSSNIVAGKRRAKDSINTRRASKRRRTRDTVPHMSSSMSVASMSPSPTDVTSPLENDTSIVHPDGHGIDDTSQSISVEASLSIQATPLPVEDTIIPSVELKQTSRPLTKIYVQPDTSKLDAHARAVFDQYEKRCSSGLFLNPYMKQKVARGRPRKALMATFRLPQLSDLEWFTSELAQDQVANRVDVTGTPEAGRIVVAQQDEKAIVPYQASPAEAPPEPEPEPDTQAQLLTNSELPELRQTSPIERRSRSPAQPQSPTAMKPRESVSDHELSSLIVNDSTLLDNESSQVGDQTNRHEPISSVSEPTVAEDAGAIPVRSASSTIVEEQRNALPEIAQRQSPQPVASAPRIVGGWAPINATERSRLTPYQSPYAASVGPEAHVHPNVLTPTPAGEETALSTAELPLPIPEVDNGASLPNANHSAIVEAPVPIIPGTKPRRAQVGGIAGTQRTLRQKLILEIIGKCHGVFPGGGEMPRPFLTLWKEKYPNLPAPSPSTITETLRNMSVGPQAKLKHWNFASQHKNMPGTTTRRMYTLPSLNERSPEVLKLAHNMAQYSQQKDYVHRVSEKSLLYYPDEIRDLIGEVVSYQPIQAAPKDESIILNQLNPELEKQITEAKLRKRSVWQKQKRLEAKARKAQNAQVEQASSKQIRDSNGAPRTKRARLASLNDKSKKLRRAPLYTASMAAFDEDSDDITNDEPATATATKSGQISLIWTQPIVAPVPEREQLSDEEPPEDDESDDEATDWAAQQAQSSVVNEQTPLPVTQLITEESSSNVTAVEPDSTGANNDASLKAADGPAAVEKGKKRVRIVAPHDPSSRKRTRITSVTSTTAQDSESIYQSSTDDAHSASETEEESEGSDNAVHSNTKKRRVRNFKGRQRGKPGPPPTLLERLTGLTGDPDDPIYQPPQRAPRPGRSHRSWNERKRARTNRFKKEQQYSQVSDSLDDFKKLFYTFIVVSSLSGEDEQIDWSLFKRIYDGDRFFDMKRAQMLWGWMQTHMSEQVCGLTRTFQSLYLEAYETGKVAAIDTPETHDWAGLVRWAMRKCAYPDLPLPVLRQALQQFTVEESNYETLDRVLWYKAATADRTRTMLQLQQSFTAPIHRSRKATWSPDDQLLKARSWVRANTATPQALYDANLAHDKFKNIGETVLVNVVGDLVDKQHLRMRKLKRLLPGRNYNFTQALAKKYARLFQLDDFMNAVEVKKKMDAAFADDDPELRHYNMSRCEEDGAFAAIMTMVNEGTVKLAPQLPPVNNEFDASLPKLSVWGFCEGGYNHRAIDRGRLFWDIHVVPTENYKFGNPLQPLSMPPSTMDDDEPAVWPALPEPPLPGKHDSGALLPIWSSIDGQSVTWPWWYRVLNLVLQPLIFLAGATAADIHSHCPEHTTELFEIELVLDWLESIKAVTRTVGGGYITLPGFWAAFGDQLRDTEDDWFGEHVKRKAKNHEKQRWRVDYALRHSTLQARKAAGADAAPAEEEDDANVPEVGAVETRTSREILKNPKQQYRIMQQALYSEQSHAEENRSDTRPASGFATPQTEQGPALNATGSKSHTPEATSTPSADVEMADADVDAEGEEDVDAEGEIDDGMY